MLLVEVGDHLGVALGREAVPRRSSVAAQLAIVVDLAVEDDDDGAVLVVDRLIARLEVDHPQAPDAQADAVLGMQTGRVRAAMDLPLAHRLHKTGGNGPASRDLAGDSAHATYESLLSRSVHRPRNG